MKTRFEFICEAHREMPDFVGWRLKTHPLFDPATGMGVAHDILEHFPDGDGGPADEFQALGASLVVRSANYYHMRGRLDICPAHHLAYEVPDIMRHIIGEEMGLPEAPKVKPQEEEYEEAIDRFIREGTRLCNAEFDYEGQERDDRFDEPLSRMGGWVRRGVQRAERRYRRRMFDIETIFIEIEKKVDECLKTANLGDRMIIRLNGHNMWPDVEVKDMYGFEK